MAGNGSSTDHYVIQGWYINASLVNGITIANTNAYFTIESVSVYAGIRGIFLTNATHCLITNSDIEWSQVAVLLESSSNKYHLKRSRYSHHPRDCCEQF